MDAVIEVTADEVPTLDHRMRYSWTIELESVNESSSGPPRRFGFGDDESFSMGDLSESDEILNIGVYSHGEAYSEGMFDTDDDDDDLNFHLTFPASMEELTEFIDLTDNPSTRTHAQPKRCRFFMRGACRYGISCRFSHDVLVRT